MEARETRVRPPAVAGTFYPAGPAELAALVDRLLAATPRARTERPPKALIVPHAGYIYSGAVAAAAFARVERGIERVVLVGPAHRVYVSGIVWPGTARLATPLGELEVDLEALSRVPAVVADAAAHAREHALEVELPFVQAVAPRAKIVPLVTAGATAAEVGGVLDALWGGPETLIVISSDLSHYLPYDAGRARDERTAARILAHAHDLAGEDACGAVAINGLMWLSRTRPLRVELVDLRSSGDTAGRREEVVGYGAFAIYEVAA